jgi:acetyl esterase/lipase
MSRTRLLLDVVKPRRSYRYGSEHRCQRADLSLPRGRGPHPVVVTIHGGSWAAGYTKLVMRGVVGDLVRQGFAVWNIEYRRVGRGQGGGWPATFADVAAAIDALGGVEEPLDLERVTLLGHSAGATLALWAGGRGSLPDGAPGARPLIMPVAVVAQAAPADLATIYEESGGGAVGWLMGGSPERYPERYALADPIARVPLPVPVLLVHGTDDRLVAVRRSRNYAAAARAAGGVVELVELAGEAGGHRQHVNPDSAAWEVVRAWLAGQLRGSRAGG